MRAVQVVSLTGPTDVVVREVDEPVAGPHDVVVEVHSVGVSFPDLLLSRGEYQVKPDPPWRWHVSPSIAGECVMRRTALVIGLGVMLAGCATGPARAPIEGVRFHSDPVAGRGTIAVEAVAEMGPAEPGTRTAIGDGPPADAPVFVGAVRDQLARAGFTPVAPGAAAQYRATVSIARLERPLPRRSSGLSIGLGGASFGGGRRGGSAVGLGGGFTFPVGGGRARTGVVTEMSVRLVRGPDAIWEGHVRTIADAARGEAASDAVAGRLAGALFAGFPGDSGRSIEVR